MLIRAHVFAGCVGVTHDASSNRGWGGGPRASLSDCDIQATLSGSGRCLRAAHTSQAAVCCGGATQVLPIASGVSGTTASASRYDSDIDFGGILLTLFHTGLCPSPRVFLPGASRCDPVLLLPVRPSTHSPRLEAVARPADAHVKPQEIISGWFQGGMGTCCLNVRSMATLQLAPIKAAWVPRSAWPFAPSKTKPDASIRGLSVVCDRPCMLKML